MNDSQTRLCKSKCATTPDAHLTQIINAEPQELRTGHSSRRLLHRHTLLPEASSMMRNNARPARSLAVCGPNNSEKLANPNAFRTVVVAIALLASGCSGGGNAGTTPVAPNNAGTTPITPSSVANAGPATVLRSVAASLTNIGQRTLLWQIGSPVVTSCEGCNGPGDPYVTDQGSIAQVDVANNLVHFHIHRPSPSSVEPIPRGEYRSMIEIFNVVSTGKAYSIYWETDATLLDKGLHSRQHTMAIHDSGGGVSPFAIGARDEASPADGSHMTWWIQNPTGAVDLPYTQGARDRWEVQQVPSGGSNGWWTLYRNGVQVFHYAGANLSSGASGPQRLDFGIYEWIWENPSQPHWSTDTTEDLTMHNVHVYSIPGPLPPL